MGSTHLKIPSLSPHVCILPSEDLKELLTASSLPGLEQILQSFSPLPQVTTRTTSLASVSHASFALRFSDLVEIEEGCKEDEEQRAVRTTDWMAARIAHRSARWIADVERLQQKDPTRTPWWDELKRCVQGDHIPSKSEGWNHPVAIILAVSTMAANPLQAITALHAREIDLPPWVEKTVLTYTLIVHPKNSTLTDEEAGALFNAVKKQYGLHSYMLPLDLPSSPPAPVPVPALVPRLPRPTADDSPLISFAAPNTAQAPAPTPATNSLNTLRLGEQDIQQTARFTREFVVMSLVPWMERRVVEWNESFSSTRRLPSRLFSTTRRLFGTPSPSPAPMASSTSSIKSHVSSSSVSTSNGSVTIGLSQHRRLAEFATILGDTRLAVAVWEFLRKEGKGGSEILPILLSPSPAIPLLAASALSFNNPGSSDTSAVAQLAALTYAVRWEIGIGSSDFLNDILNGERWLVWAAGNGDEPPSALLLAQAALLSTRKNARRRAALWYLTAANRLEKFGIKPLTMYFLRQAHHLYQHSPAKDLSPLFWESEGKSPLNTDSVNSIMSAIEHPLGRLSYTTGDIAGAVRFFLGLLRPSESQLAISHDASIPTTDKVFLDDFRVAYAHYKSTAGGAVLTDLKLPFNFCAVDQTRVRLPRDNSNVDADTWAQREASWRAFWKLHGSESLAPSGKAAVDETFWIDVTLKNPLDTEVNLAKLTLIVEEEKPSRDELIEAFITVEVIDEVVLSAKETRSISVPIKSSRPTTLLITHLTYDFLALLPSVESVATRGRRLHDTALQRQIPTYAPEVKIKVAIAEASHKLIVDFVDDSRLVLAQGERKQMQLWLSNTGTKPIADCWLLAGPEDDLWISSDEESNDSKLSLDSEIIHSSNSIKPSDPCRITLPGTSSMLSPDESVDFPVVLHADRLYEQDLCLLFIYREPDGQVFHSARVTRHYDVQPILKISASAESSHSMDHMFILDCEIENLSSSSTVQITQVTTVSPSWHCSPITKCSAEPLAPVQSSRWMFGVTSWKEATKTEKITQFVKQQLRNVIHGISVETLNPPFVDLLCNHIFKSTQSTQLASRRHFIHSGRRNVVARAITDQHPHIPFNTHPSIFPLYHPSALDLVIFWEMPTQARSGHLLASGINLGAEHALLKEIVEEAEGAKIKRSMYAETQREKMEVLEAIRSSEWNMEMDPICVISQPLDSIQHDFSTGPRCCPVTFTLRNYSKTHIARYLFKVMSTIPPDDLALSDLLAPSFSGRLTFKGSLQPMAAASVQTNVWLRHPGAYSLDAWQLETEVGENISPVLWKPRHRYLRHAPLDGTSITISAL